MNTQMATKLLISLKHADLFRLLFFSLNTLGLGVTKFGRLVPADKRVIRFNVFVLSLNIAAFLIVQLNGSMVANTE